jgi:hypothetical protein
MKTDQTPNPPTTFELSQLATMVPNLMSAKPNSFADAVKAAERLWSEAENASIRRNSQMELKAIVDGIFTLNERDFQRHCDAYQGSKSDIIESLSNARYTIDDVKTRLFKDKALQSETLDKLIESLPKIADPPGLIDYTPRVSIAELHAGGTLNGRQCRWLFGLRQKQISRNKKRDIPQSLKSQSRRSTDGESIQYKRPLKA